MIHTTVQDFSITTEVKRLVEALPIGGTISMPVIYETLMREWPNATEQLTALHLRTSIAAALNAVGKTGVIAVPEKDKDIKPYQWQKVANAPPTGSNGHKRQASNGQKPLSKSSQDVDKNRTTSAIATRQPARLQTVKPDKSQDKILADISVSSETANRATYALPSFVVELRAERDDLDLLIALLEKRMLRGGGGRG